MLWLWLWLLLLVLLLVFLLLGGRGEINRFLTRRCWPDRACDGDKGVPGFNFWGRLGCPSWRWSG